MSKNFVRFKDILVASLFRIRTIFIDSV